MDKSKNEKVDLSLNNEEFLCKYGRKKIVSVYTLGCKVNQYESEVIADIFKNSDYEIVDFLQKADVYVINTCTVTGLSARKSRQMIRKAKSINKDALVVAVGCYAQVSPEEVRNIEGVSLVIGTKDRSRIVEYIHALENTENCMDKVEDIMGTRTYEELRLGSHTERTRAFIKIQEGCTQFCSYCIIPYARGPIRSRQPEDVLEEAFQLVEQGFNELVLTGIHIASYGKDLKDTSLLDILQRIHEIPKLERIRLGSIEPTILTEEFTEALHVLSKVCPHYHVSLQSGCDETLKRMNRKYTTAEYRKGITLLRNAIKDVAITTDVMVGFPGETEEEFLKTMYFIEQMSFAKIHVFKYSPRKGTPAALYVDQVNPQIKEQRSECVMKLSQKDALLYHQKFIGQTMKVLFENEVSGMSGRMEGMTSNYIRVFCRGDMSIRRKILWVVLKEAIEDYVVGEIIS